MASTSPIACFETRDLCKVYGEGAGAVHALRGVNLLAPEGELVVLLGPSGSGKSTLLNILGGLDRGSSGEVFFRGRPLHEASERQLTRYRRNHVGFVFQFYNLMPSLTALENVALVTEVAHDPLPPEEALEIKPVMDAHELDMIFLVAPTTSDARIKLIGKAGSGYLYYVSLKGVTGSASLNVDEVASRVETIRNLAQLPIGVGFGIKDAESAQAVSRVSDGVVVGSALVNQIAANPDNPEAINKAISDILAAMRNAMDQ